MGNHSIVTAERYAHLIGENLRTVVEKVEALLPKSLPSSTKVTVIHFQAHSLTIRKNWCGGRELNPQSPFRPRDFKSLASASSATPARGKLRNYFCGISAGVCDFRA